MSAIEYNSLLFEISQRLDDLNVREHLLFMCRGKLASGSEDNIQDVLSLFKELEEQNNLGTDRLQVMKEMLKGVREWSLFGKVKKFESKRKEQLKEYNGLLEQIIRVLDELDDLERLIAMCRGKISEESEVHIEDVPSLFKELENQNNLGIDRLETLKGILTETEKNDLLEEVEKFEERRNQEDEVERREDEFKRRKAQAVALASSFGNKLMGVLNIKTVFTVVAGGITVVSISEVLSRWSTFDQLVTAFNSCVLPAGTGLVKLTEGCVCLTVRAETLSALTTLWNLYQDGTLETRLYNFFVTDEIRELAGGEEVEVTVTIEEQEYEKACLEFINEAQEAASIGDGGRIRRKSDSAVYCSPKEELPLSKLERIETELKVCKERIAVMEKEIEIFSLDLEARSPEEKATFFKQKLEGRKARKAREAREMDESADNKPEISQRLQAKLMDPEKFAFVEKYLEDVQERQSMTTEASDSGLGTHAAASELGMEEISESNKLRLKDLSKDVIRDLNGKLRADEATMEKFQQFFGLNRPNLPMWKGYSQAYLSQIENLFPDTTVGGLKECFEALQLYDLAELLEKVRPRSLRPALSQEQVEQLRVNIDRPTKYHSNVAVLVVKHLVGENTVESDNAEKIEAFFKDLNSRNDVTTIALPSSLPGLRRLENELERLEEWKKRVRDMLEIQLSRQRMVEIQWQKEVGKMVGSPNLKQLSARRRQIREDEVEKKHQLEKLEKEVALLIEQRETTFKPQMEERQKENEKAMDKLIQNQDKFTCIAVFVISDDTSSLETMLQESGVMEKLALIPDHAKLVVTPSEWTAIGTVPETLHVTCACSTKDTRRYGIYPGRSIDDYAFYSSMIEVFNKRRETLDLVSMMQELSRTLISVGNSTNLSRVFHIKDNLSTLLRFKKTEEKGSVY